VELYLRFTTLIVQTFAQYSAECRYSRWPSAVPAPFVSLASGRDKMYLIPWCLRGEVNSTTGWVRECSGRGCYRDRTRTRYFVLNTGGLCY
jgi:hypothetical protein